MKRRYLTPEWAEVWDDLRVNPANVSEIGARSPERVIYKTDGSSGSSYAIQLNGSTQYGEVLDYDNLDTSPGNYSIEFWTKPEGSLGMMLYRDGYFEISKQNNSLVVSIANSWDIWVSNALLNNATTHIVVTVKLSGSNSIVIIYVNGIKKIRRKLWGYTLGASTSPFYIGYDGDGQYYQGIIDNITIYNVTLSADQVAERYNNGHGSTSLPTSITETTDVVANFLFNEGSGSTVDNRCTLGTGYDMTLYNSPTWVAGLINDSSSSFGVVVWKFNKNVTNELFFSRQLPHSYKEGTAIEAHIHWINPSNETGNVVWGLEYTWANVGSSFNNTTIARVSAPVWGQDIHMATDIVRIDGRGKKISSIIICRLFRDGGANEDTLNDGVYLMEFDFHYQIDYPGSMATWVKEA